MPFGAGTVFGCAKGALMAALSAGDNFDIVKALGRLSMMLRTSSYYKALIVNMHNMRW